MIVCGRPQTKHLQRDPHIRHHQPEDLTAHLEYISDRTCCVSAQGKTNVLLDGMDKPSRLSTAGALDAAEWRQKYIHVL